MTTLVAYRHAAYDTPWWAFPSSRGGRFHRAGVDVVQYLCLHPLGPGAEVLRHDVGPTGDPDQVRLNLWAARVDAGDALTITFDDCDAHGLRADELVGDDYAPTRRLADTCRARGVDALIVPSAALSGTDNLVLLGPRLLQSYAWEPVSALEVPTGHLTDRARPPAELHGAVRWIGTPHPALEQWKTTGRWDRLADPLAGRW